MVNSDKTCKEHRSTALCNHIMQLMRWAALLLLFGIGAAEVILQYSRGQEVSWMFSSLCFVGGIMLFVMGRSMVCRRCPMKKASGGCPGERASMRGESSPV